MTWNRGLAVGLVWLLGLGLGVGTVAADDDHERSPELAVYRLAADLGQLSALRRSVDVWAYSPATADQAGEATVLLAPHEVEALLTAGFDLRLDEAQTRRHVDPIAVSRGASGIPGFSCYRTVEETYADLAAAATARPELATWQDLGDSWEKTNLASGYDVPVLILTNGAITGPKPTLVLIAAMHAREYTTAELATRFALHMIAEYGTDPEVTWLLDHREIHVIPQMNPDGRKQAEGGKFWRKNANNDHCGNSDSRGVDLNRNASFLWGSGS
ncbi:MAG: M14 family zinc carboxypeptidase, partial [Acidobacteriota bacterium]